MANDRLTMTVPEVAETFGISRAHAYELVREGRIPSLRLGRRLVVPKNALQEFIDRACTLGN